MPQVEVRSSDLLQRRIGWLCQLVRWGAVAYGAWVLLAIALYWSDAGRVARHWSAWLHVDVSPPGPAQLAGGLAVHLVLWLAAAAACFAVWRLFTLYSEGRIFAADAALWLRRIGVYGLIAQFGDMLARPLVSMIVTAHMPTGGRMVSVFANPPDLLNVLFLAGFVALAHVFRAAVDVADENAQIV